jgi:cytochrome P450
MIASGVDFSDPGFYAADPHAVYARLRAESPVCWFEDQQLWAVTSHTDVLEVSRHPERFCSGQGILLADRERHVSASDSIVYQDPPLHHRYRALVSPGFHPRRVRQLEDFVRRLAVDLLEPVAADEPIEVVSAFASPLPVLVIAELLGVPTSDRERFRTWSDAIIVAANDLTNLDPETAQAGLELFTYFSEVIAERRAEPGGDDLISVLTASEVEGEPLSEADLLGFCLTLLVAGNETTRTLISGGLLALSQFPDEWRRLVAEPTLATTAVEELLRWVTPIMSFGRTATADTVLADQAIAEGAFLLLLYASANRDDAVFGPSAATLDVGRQPNPHVAFGFGEHFCLGAQLARLEARVLLEELSRRFSDLSIAGEPQRVSSTLVNGWHQVPLVFSR